MGGLWLPESFEHEVIHPITLSLTYTRNIKWEAKYGGTVRNGIEFLKRQFAQELNIAESDHELKPIPAQLEKMFGMATQPRALIARGTDRQASLEFYKQWLTDATGGRRFAIRDRIQDTMQAARAARENIEGKSQGKGKRSSSSAYYRRQ